MGPLVSVVMPIYNAEKYLKHSVESFMNQTLKDIELIAVDDASTDRTAIILEEYARKDARVRVIHLNKNSSSNIARKTGVMQASGKYIMFLDSDDALAPNACKRAYDLIFESKADVLQFDTQIVALEKQPYEEEIANQTSVPDEETPEIKSLKTFLKAYPGRLTGENVLRGCFEQQYYSFTLWNKIYTKTVCQKGFSLCPDIYLNMSEDQLAFFYIAYHSNTYVGKPGEKLYLYTFGSGISTQNKVTLSQVQNMANALTVPEEIKNFLLSEDRFKYFFNAYQAIYIRLSDALFTNLDVFLKSSSPSQGGRAIDAVWTRCNDIKLIEFFADRFFYQPHTIFQAIRHMSMDSAAARPIRTIGTFYHRIRNGGVERVISFLIPLWYRMGYKVVLFTDEPPNDADYQIDVPFTRIVLPTCDISLGGMDYAKRSKALATALQDHQVDAMIYHGWLSPYLPWDLLVCKQSGSAFCIHTHSTIDCLQYADSGSKRYFAQLPYIYGLSDGVLALSETDTAFWGQFVSWSFQIINPLSIEAPQGLARKKCGKNIMWVGRISEEKNPADAILILEKVVQTIPDAKMYFVGGGEKYQNEQIYQLAKKLGLADHVIFTGFQLNVEPFYRKADMLLSTSSYEGFSMALFEAQSFGLPIVMFDLPYLSILNEKSGIIRTEQHSIEDAAKALITLMQDDALYSQLSAEAMENARMFAKVDQAAQWENVLKMLEEPKSYAQQGNSALRNALEYWIRFTQSCWNVPHSGMAVGGQEVNAYLVNMTVKQSVGQLFKSIARRILGRDRCDRIHLWRERRRKE